MKCHPAATSDSLAIRRSLFPMNTVLTPILHPVRDKVLRELGPVKSLSRAELASRSIGEHTLERTGKLPPQHLIYFTLVELLGFTDLGQEEKVAWSIPVEIDGIPLMVAFVKFGLRIIGSNDEASRSAAEKLAVRIQKAVRAATPFFSWMAENAIKDSAVNVLNISADLVARYRYLRDLHRTKSDEAELRSNEVIETRGTNDYGGTWTQYSRPSFQLRKEAKWLGLAAVEAFFSWSEHVFIHLAVLRGSITTAE